MACLVIFGLLFWPQISAWQSVKKIQKSLSGEQRGASVKDYLDRNEKSHAELAKKLTDHITWSEGYRKGHRRPARPAGGSHAQEPLRTAMTCGAPHPQLGVPCRMRTEHRDSSGLLAGPDLRVAGDESDCCCSHSPGLILFVLAPKKR